MEDNNNSKNGDKRDQLERFVDQNREGFDREKPTRDLWKDISKELPITDKPKVRTIPLYRALQYAAILVLGVAIGVYYFTHELTEKNVLAKVESDRKNESKVMGEDKSNTGNPEIQLSDFSKDLAEAEAYYTKEVDYKLKQLEELEMDEEALEEIRFLDEEFKSLKEELGETNNEEVISAMIENYQLKLSILENIMEQYKRIEEDDNKQENEEGTTYL